MHLGNSCIHLKGGKGGKRVLGEGWGANLDPGIETPYVSCLEISRDDFTRIYFEGNLFFLSTRTSLVISKLVQ